MTWKSLKLVLVSYAVSFLCAISLVGAAEPRIQILSPKDGAQIAEDQKTILISGKVASDNVRSANVDIFLILDTSGSTVLSAGAEFANQAELPDKYVLGGAPASATTVFDFSPWHRNGVAQLRVVAAQSPSFDSWR